MKIKKLSAFIIILMVFAMALCLVACSGASVAIESIECDEQGRIIITLTDGTVLDPIEMSESHAYGDWQAFGSDNSTCENKMFYRVCSKCNEAQFRQGSYADHDWSTITIESTCQSQGYDHKTCKTCGKEEKTNYQPLSDHRWQNEYSTDNSYHWVKCNDCDEIDDRQEHTPDDSGYCTVCDGASGTTEGVLYYVSADQTYAEVTGYEGTAKRVIIAEEYQGKPVKSIYKNAFRDSNIISVVLPNSITSIGEYAFAWCESLTSIIIPDSVTSIGNCAFEWCSSLTSITIPDSVTSIGNYVFSGCNYLLTTENNLKYVNANGNPYYLLIEPTNRNAATYNINTQTKRIGNGAFNYCSGLLYVTIPNSVTSIGSSAFRSCSSLANVTIGNSVTSIDSYAFYGCTSLTNLTIPDSVKNVGGHAFFDCNSLTNVTIGKGVTNIGDAAFRGCSLLTNVTIPNSVKNIGEQAFYNCTSLTNVTIGRSVRSIGEKAFENISATKVNYTGKIEDWVQIEFASVTSNPTCYAKDLQ